MSRAISELTIKKFLNEMSKQDNLGTASPYYYVIRSRETLPAPLECATETAYMDPMSPERSFPDLDQMKSCLRADGCSEEEVEEVLERVVEYGTQKIWAEHGMFLTEKEAKEHLEVNNYHYTHDAHTYLKHAWRAPEMKEFFSALFEHFDIPKDNTEYRTQEEK